MYKSSISFLGTWFSGRDFLKGEMGNISPALGVLHGHGADVPFLIEINDCIFVQVTTLNYFDGTKLIYRVSVSLKYFTFIT